MKSVYEIPVTNINTNVTREAAHVKDKYIIDLGGFYLAPVPLVLVNSLGDFFHIPRTLIAPKIVRHVNAHIAVIKVNQTPTIKARSIAPALCIRDSNVFTASHRTTQGTLLGCKCAFAFCEQRQT